MLQPNKNEPDQSAIDAVNLSRIRAAQDAHASETGSLRSVFARADAQGLHLAAAKRAIKAMKAGKTDEMIAEFERTIFYLKLMGKPVTKEVVDQFELFTESAPEDEKAALEGRAAGLAGHEENQNPYDPGSAKGQSWLKACREGKAERELVLSMPEPDPVESETEGNEDE